MWEIIEKIVVFFLVKLLKFNLSEKNIKDILQFVKFAVVGLSNTLISYLLYVVSLSFFEKQMLFKNVDYLVAQLIAFVLSVLWSFYWNNKYVFEKKEGEQRNLLQALAKTYISYAFTGLFLNSILSIIWIEVFKWPKLLAPLINLVVSVPLNFLINKFWAFRNK